MTLNFEPFPQLDTSRLHLRQIRETDVNQIFRLRSDESVTRYLLRAPYKSAKEALEFIRKINRGIANREWIYWGITTRTDDAVMGSICLWNIVQEHFRAEVGYELHPDFQQKGFMAESLEAVLQYGFKEMKLHSIAGNVHPDNRGSIKLLESNGFMREAYFKENIFYNGKFGDTLIYSLITPYS